MPASLDRGRTAVPDGVVASSSVRRLLDAFARPLSTSTAAAVRIGSAIGNSAPALARGLRRPAVREVLLRQILFTGVEAIPFTLLVSFLVAAAVAVQAQAPVFGGAALLGKLLVVLIVRELGPLVVGTIVVARSGTAMAAELGAMRVSREVDGLAAMGVDPFEYLVAPRIAGAAVSLSGLAAVFVASALLAAAALTALLGHGPNAAEHLHQVAAHLSGRDLAAVAAKVFVPGLLVAAIACDEGLAATGATQVPPAVRAAAVRSIAAVFAWDTLVTAVLYLT
jgi:phospholipid/cholesterol/gamma-HCH transport system permease protein